MLTDWLIFLDLLEENNYNTTFLRFITPITFTIIETHFYNYNFGYGLGNSYGNGNGDGFGYNYSNFYDEEH